MSGEETPMKRDKRGLGRGLSALMADIQPETATGVARPTRSEQLVAIDAIHPNPDQPRRRFAREALEELAASIKEKGIIQPLIVRPDPSDPAQYQLVAGERRWRAAQLAQIHDIPVLIRDFDDTEVLEVAIIENIQRADLNPIEEAAGYRQLMDRFGHTQEKLAEAMGKSRSHVANMLRLLNLPDPVQDMLREGALSAGHARALITAENPLKIAQDIVSKGLSVRDVEKLLRKNQRPSQSGSHPAARPSKDADTAALERDLSAQLKMPVSISYDPGTGGGKIAIRYRDLGELDDLVRLFGGG